MLILSASALARIASAKGVLNLSQLTCILQHVLLSVGVVGFYVGYAWFSFCQSAGFVEYDCCEFSRFFNDILRYEVIRRTLRLFRHLQEWLSESLFLKHMGKRLTVRPAGLRMTVAKLKPLCTTSRRMIRLQP